MKMGKLRIQHFLFYSGVALFLGACQLAPPPREEYILARTALDAAKQSQSHRYSPGHWSKAEMAYRRGQIYFQERDYGRAREEFIKARQSAEKAENSARLIRSKNGDVL